MDDRRREATAEAAEDHLKPGGATTAGNGYAERTGSPANRSTVTAPGFETISEASFLEGLIPQPAVDRAGEPAGQIERGDHGEIEPARAPRRAAARPGGPPRARRRGARRGRARAGHRRGGLPKSRRAPPWGRARGAAGSRACGGAKPRPASARSASRVAAISMRLVSASRARWRARRSKARVSSTESVSRRTREAEGRTPGQARASDRMGARPSDSTWALYARASATRSSRSMAASSARRVVPLLPRRRVVGRIAAPRSRSQATSRSAPLPSVSGMVVAKDDRIAVAHLTHDVERPRPLGEVRSASSASMRAARSRSPSTSWRRSLGRAGGDRRPSAAARPPEARCCPAGTGARGAPGSRARAAPRAAPDRGDRRARGRTGSGCLPGRAIAWRDRSRDGRSRSPEQNGRCHGLREAPPIRGAAGDPSSHARPHDSASQARDHASSPRPPPRPRAPAQETEVSTPWQILFILYSWSESFGDRRQPGDRARRLAAGAQRDASRPAGWASASLP